MKEFIRPEFELVILSDNDIIATSGCCDTAGRVSPTDCMDGTRCECTTVEDGNC